MHSAKANSWCPWTLPFVDPTPQALERHVATTHEGTFLVEGKSTYTFALPDGHQVKGRDLRFSGPVETSTPRYAPALEQQCRWHLKIWELLPQYPLKPLLTPPLDRLYSL
jgi:hypothetical protein